VVRTIDVGYHRTVLLDAAGAIMDAVKAGKVSRFFVIGGCDGAEPGRNYFKDYAEATPPDSFILTLGCGKYRINDHDYGKLLGLPRLPDMGQCNDAYGAIQVALALAKAFDCGANDLPLTLAISWFEQKAVAVLLTLLSLGVKGIIWDGGDSLRCSRTSVLREGIPCVACRSSATCRSASCGTGTRRVGTRSRSPGGTPSGSSPGPTTPAPRPRWRMSSGCRPSPSAMSSTGGMTSARPGWPTAGPGTGRTPS
jgi:hypothetical protein